MDGLFTKHAVKQLGYVVDDLDAAIAYFSRTYGIGPFVDMGVNPAQSTLVRGESVDLKTRTADAQLGNLQIELIEVVDHSVPNPYDELGRTGLHHICIWVDDLDVAVEELQGQGYEIAMDMVSGSGARVVYFDTREVFGHYLEVNEPMDAFWNGIKALDEHWDGKTVSITIQDFMKMAQGQK